MNNEELNLEQQHLTATYNKLLDMKKDLEDQIAALDEKAMEEKNDIRDNLRFDYADDETSMETLGEIEVWNRYIDTYNVESNSLGKRLRTITKLLESPYFAKVTVQFDPSEEPESYYIGRASISQNRYQQMIIDWRSPIAEVYYNQENGHTHYTVDDREIEVDLKLRRQFDLEKNKLNSYFDTQIAIEDPMLLHSLSQTRSDKMQAITATIQKEQNTIIRYPDVPVLLVDGIAGSGKTSVLLQRIAYLFYQKRDTLRPDQVCLMTLNPVFRDYIDNVLPDLGESNPLTITWQEFLDMAGVPIRDNQYDSTEAESLMKIQKNIPKLTPEAEDFFDITQKENVVLTKEEVLQIVSRYRQFPLGSRLIQNVSEELEQRAKSAMKNMDHNDEDTSEGSAKSDEAEDNRIENDYGGALKQIRNCAFVNVAHIVKRILKTDHITATEWLFAKMELTGLCDKNIRYVMVDEVQDYTLAQMQVFYKYFPSARFMLLGDEYQAIREGTVTFAELEELAKSYKKRYAELPLLTSYRSSPEITDMFASILPPEKEMLVSSVKRPGEKVSVQSFKSEKEYFAELKKLVAEYGEMEGLTAVICRDQYSLEKISAALGDNDIYVVSGHESLPARGALLIELVLAKGLEFDHVILADADRESYPDDELGRHCLYTAMSRATQHLTVLSLGDGVCGSF